MKSAKMKAETIVAKLFAAMTERRQALVDGGFTVSDEITKKNGLLDHFNPEGNSYRSFVDAVDKTKAIFDFAPLLRITAKAKPAGANDTDYIQVKALEKVVKFVKAFGQRDFRVLDNHTRSITVNTMVNSGVISSRAAFATLVRVEFDGEDSTRLVERNRYTAGTGSTQLSSTRELYRLLGMTEGIKGAKDQNIVFTEETKNALLEHFDTLARKVGAPVTEDAPESEEETEAE